MRKWRVGSISMGLSLVMLGLLLFLSRVQDKPVIEPFMIWWPVIMIILGLEIVVHLFLSRQDHPILRYDILSIVFVGMIGTVGIAFTLLTSSGLFQELEAAVAAETHTYELPSVERPLGQGVERVVVEPGRRAINLEAAEGEMVHVFGTYRATVSKAGEPPIQSASDYLMTKTVGDTLYIELKEPSHKEGPFQTHPDMEATLIIPANVRLEVRGNYNEIDLSALTLQDDWLIENAGQVRVHLRDQHNLQLTALSRSPLDEVNHPWDEVETQIKDARYEPWYRGSLKIGEGEVQLKIMGSESVLVEML